ncbi:hypothetical protein CspeluHIS016_0306250 [Cutaneotrichosporon spelunceum]|uniref:Required for respiratory growth protein 9, mitochondrial n=1 Tax=Cutaneotrichosporon spelunceum TaxID=1672016 RepID=A0AAD3TUM8_9TREE|nr:hypothetical protein CspeluHIS016_0306250 [Cutaneotrichosporon spelunceum]
MLRALRPQVRQLHTTSARAVRRPQKPFEAFIPRDPSAKPKAGNYDKRQAAQEDKQYALAEEGRVSKTEKYSARFGLRTPGTDYKPSWERKAEWDAERALNRRGAEGIEMEDRAETSRQARDAGGGDQDLASLRRKAMQRSDVKQVLEKWRSGADINAGAFALRAKELEAMDRKSHRVAERKAQRRTSEGGMRPESRGSEPVGRWQPTKRLTYAAMSGMRELHAQDPETWTPQALGTRFGISYEAAKRILRSTWSPTAADKDVGKWSRGTDGVNSPVPQIRAVYELKRADDAAGKALGIAAGNKVGAVRKMGGKAKPTSGGRPTGPKEMAKGAGTRTGGKSNGKQPPPVRQRGGFGINEE